METQTLPNSSRGSSSGKTVVLTVIVILIVLAVIFLFWHRQTKSGPRLMDEAQFKAIQSDGIQQAFLFGEPMQKVSTIYSGLSSSGSQQTGVTFVVEKTLPEVWSYYNGYFSDNKWVFANGASTASIPSAASTAPVIFSVSNSQESVVVYATPSGAQQTTVKISAFLNH